MGYNINVLQLTACLAVDPITVGNFAYLFNSLLLGPLGLTSWIFFAPLFSFMYCWVLIFALFPFYILIYKL